MNKIELFEQNIYLSSLLSIHGFERESRHPTAILLKSLSQQPRDFSMVSCDPSLSLAYIANQSGALVGSVAESILCFFGGVECGESVVAGGGAGCRALDIRRREYLKIGGGSLA